MSEVQTKQPFFVFGGMAMKLEYIYENWRNRQNNNLAASITAWDSVAEDYVHDGKITFENDAFLKLMERKIELSGDMSVLDVGCGAGAYCAALAPRVRRVDGVDFSPRMIATAVRFAQQNGIKNARFLERDWYTCSEEEFYRKYDVVFAHTTPAIADCAALVKMARASKRYCFLCKPARRTDDVFDRLKEIAGCKDDKNDDSVAYAFDTIWALGSNPEVSYQDTVWRSEKPLKDVLVWYLGRLNGICQVDGPVAAEIEAYLRSIARDGIVTETISTTLVNLFWEVRE